MREMEEPLMGGQETKNENFRKKYDSTIKATFSFIIVVTVFSCLLYVTRQPGDNYVTGLTIPVSNLIILILNSIFELILKDEIQGLGRVSYI